MIDTNYDVKTCEVVILMTFIGRLHGPTLEAGAVPRQRLGVTYVYGGGIYGRTTLSRRYSEILSLPPGTVELQMNVHKDFKITEKAPTSASQFHVYLLWAPCTFSIVS